MVEDEEEGGKLLGVMPFIATAPSSWPPFAAPARRSARSSSSLHVPPAAAALLPAPPPLLPLQPPHPPPPVNKPALPLAPLRRGLDLGAATNAVKLQALPS